MQANLAPGRYVALDANSQTPPLTTFTIARASSPATLPTPQATVSSIEFGFRGALAVTGITGAAAQPAQPFIHVSLITTNPANALPLSVIVTGSINVGGVDHQGSGTVDQLALSWGGFTLTHSQGVGTPRFNSRTCVFPAPSTAPTG